MNRNMKEVRQLLLPVCWGSMLIRRGSIFQKQTQARIGTCLACLRNSKVISVARTGWGEDKSGRNESQK